MNLLCTKPRTRRTGFIWNIYLKRTHREGVIWLSPQIYLCNYAFLEPILKLVRAPWAQAHERWGKWHWRRSERRALAVRAPQTLFNIKRTVASPLSQKVLRWFTTRLIPRVSCCKHQTLGCEKWCLSDEKSRRSLKKPLRSHQRRTLGHSNDPGGVPSWESWATSLERCPEISAEKLFCYHLLGGLRPAAEQLPCPTTDMTDFNNNVIRTIPLDLDFIVWICSSNGLLSVGIRTTKLLILPTGTTLC